METLYDDGKFKSELYREKSTTYRSTDSSNVIIDTLSRRGDEDKKTLRKEYVDLSYDEVIRYSILQSWLSQYVFIIPKISLDSKKDAYTLFGPAQNQYGKSELLKDVDYIDIRVLPLSLDEVYPACDIKTKKELTISKPFYVPGDELGVRDESKSLHPSYSAVIAILEDALTYEFKEHGIKQLDFHRMNFKFAKTANGFMFLTMTDISSQLKKFVNDRSNIELAERLKNEKGDSLQQYLDDLPRKVVNLETDFDKWQTHYNLTKYTNTSGLIVV